MTCVQYAIVECYVNLQEKFTYKGLLIYTMIRSNENGIVIFQSPCTFTASLRGESSCFESTMTTEPAETSEPSIVSSALML